MENIQLLISAYAWQIGALVAVIIAGMSIRRYGRMLERQTRDRGKRLDR